MPHLYVCPVQGRHDAHNPGTWFWPHMNTTAEWSDWADGQPDNFGHEDCLAMKVTSGYNLF